MKIALQSGRALQAFQVRAFEDAQHLVLPGDYREFVLKHDGATPEPNIFSVAPDNNCGINKFIPLFETVNSRESVDHVSCQFLPIAWAEGGNYVCLDLDCGGEVFFWDHEEPTALPRLAKTFGEFLGTLRPFSAADVVFRPGQVKHAWIDPEFLQNLKDKGELE